MLQFLNGQVMAPKVSYSDIDNFWQAYDDLADATSEKDSFIQVGYLDHALNSK